MPSTVSAIGSTAMRLAFAGVSIGKPSTKNLPTHIFDIRARVNRNDITMLDTKVVADDTVETGAAIIKIVIGENDQDGILSLLSTDKNGITAEELKGLHCVVGKGDNGVVIVDSIGNPETWLVYLDRAVQMWGPDVHQLVGLLLLLENGGGSILLLYLRLATSCWKGCRSR